MKAIIRLRNRELGDKVAKALDPIAKIGGEVWNLPTVKELTQHEIEMLYNIWLPYLIDNYVFIENRGVVEVFELEDDEYARFNPESPDVLSGVCQLKRYNHIFCRDSAELLEALVAWMIAF